MRISTQTDIIFPAFGIDEGMKIFKEAGFDALDFSMFYMNSSRESVLGNMGEDELVNKLLESSDKYSLPFNQAHAPFPSYRFGDEEYNKFVYEKLKLSIRIAGKIGKRLFGYLLKARPELAGILVQGVIDILCLSPQIRRTCCGPSRGSMPTR